MELQRVIDDTLPLLQAVEPQDLAFTLGAVADALRGRGDRLGENLAATGEYFGEINTVLPQLQADISHLADFADTYQGAADDLLAVLDNLAVTNSTIVDQEEQLRRTFTVGASSANTMAGFLETNERNLISLAETSRPVLGLFAEYSPIYPCLLEGLTRSVPRIGETFGADGDPALNLNIQVAFPPRNPYEPGDQPAYLDRSGPDCMGLDRIDEEIAQAEAGEYYCPYPAEDGIESRGGCGAIASRSATRAARTTAATPRRPRTSSAGNALPSTWPDRPRSWTSSAASSATRPGGSPGTCPTCRPRAWRPCCAGSR